MDKVEVWFGGIPIYKTIREMKNIIRKNGAG